MTNNKLISTLLLVIMLLSPFAFADDVRLVKVSDLKPDDIILDENGNEFQVGEIKNYNDGSVGIRGTETWTGMTGMAVGGLGRITGMAGVEGVHYTSYTKEELADLVTAKDLATTNLRTAALNIEKCNSDILQTEISQKAAYSNSAKKALAEQLTEQKANLVTAKQKLLELETASTEATEALAGATPPTGGSTWLSNTLGGEGITTHGFADTLLSGVQWAFLAYMAGQMIGPMIGMDKDNTKALSTAMAAGFGSYKALAVYNFKAKSIGAKYFSQYAGWWGLAIGAVVFLMMYKKSETKTVTFNCMPWQAPVGGNVCEKCNDEKLLCSEYRCKSLGQNCEIVNAGTADEKCVNINPRDVNPPTIKPNYEKLSKGYKYTNVKNSPPGPGFKIVNMEAGDGCLKAFTPLEFGISVDEPAQCKIDFNHTEKFDDMITYIGGSNLYSYNHTEKFALPSVTALKNASMILENGKDLTFFIRCKDKNGNENGAEYAVNFCIDPTPDNTAPKVEATSVLNGGCVAENQDKVAVIFYTNEPADCKWSSQDQDYDLMQNDMNCNNALYQSNAMQLFSCATELTGISREETKFYIRCKDQPGVDENDRNENKESFEFSLRGSTGLKMKDLLPNGTIFGAVSPMPIELKVKTLFGCNEGQAICKWSATGDGRDWIQFFNTNNEDGIHIQKLNLVAGAHKYFVQCVDEGGNLVEDSVTFTLDIDTSAPVVARIYEEDGMLKIVTVRDSECSYTFDNCDFIFDEGTEMPYSNSSVHVAEWNDEKTYYIKCRDEFRNEDADCSVVVKPTRNFL